MEGSGRIRLLLFIFGLLILALALLYVASFTQGGSRPPSTGTRATPTNPFTKAPKNPFATESSYQNPFETTQSGEQKYQNPFENLK